MGILDRIKTTFVGSGNDYDRDDDLYRGEYQEAPYDGEDDGYQDDGGYGYEDEDANRGYSPNGYGRPGRGGLSDEDGYDYDDPNRTRYDDYGPRDSRPERYERDDERRGASEPSQTEGIQYRSSSSADSVHVLSRSGSAADTRRSKVAEPDPTGEMRIVRASRYEDIEVVSRYYCAGDTVALVLANVKPEIGHRILDFSLGVVSALGGKVDHVFGSVFVLTHGTGGITDDDRNTLREQGLIE